MRTGGVISWSSSSFKSRGFALVAVLGVVLIVSGVALALTANMRTEVQQASLDRSALEAEQLAAAGQEMAVYLQARGLGTALENLSGLPVEVVERGFHYRLRFPTNQVDLYLDGEDGKINLSTARPELLVAFFGLWTRDSERAQELAAAVTDFRDPDDIALPGGGETEAYAALGYSPRNRALGVGDMALLRGLRPEDFRDQLMRLNPASTTWERRAALGRFVTRAPVGSTLNPNFASALVLSAVPGLDDAVVSRVVSERQRSLFKDWKDFAIRAGVPEQSAAVGFLHFGRQVPGVLTIARSRDGRTTRSERRVVDPFGVEYNRIPEYVRGG